MKKVEEILQQLVSFDTICDKDNDRIMDWIGGFCLERGFDVRKITNKEDGKAALVARIGKSGNNGLVFMGHTDTVPAGEGWKTDPFELTRKNNDFFALGSSDMKGGIAAMLAAIDEIDPSKLDKGLELIFTYDEEKNFEGIKNVVKNHKVSADCILIGEPTELEPVVATKGAVAFNIDFIGKEAHGSNPKLGVNAIEMASDFVAELKKYFKKIEKKRNSIFDCPSATLNIAKISGGDAINKVPSFCSLEFESRIIDNKQKDDLKKGIADIIKKKNFKAKADLNFSLPVSLCSDKKIVTAVEEIANKKAVGVSYATEASFLPGLKNFVIMGPGSIKVAHKANEKVSKKALDGAVVLYKEMIERFCV